MKTAGYWSCRNEIIAAHLSTPHKYEPFTELFDVDQLDAIRDKYGVDLYRECYADALHEVTEAANITTHLRALGVECKPIFTPDDCHVILSPSFPSAARPPSASTRSPARLIFASCSSAPPTNQNHKTEVHKMSCFIMSDQAHAATANTLEYILNSGFNRFGFDAPDSLYKALSDCRDRYGFYCSGLIFRRLYDLNSRAYAGRYKTDADTTPPEMPSVPPLVQEREREDQHEKLLPWHYKLAKLIDCEIYQASEDATRKDPLLLALIDFSRVYTHFLVSNTADYNAAPWGTI